ncbi:MAG TPA: transglycosylase SLT domain-containing protein, partial [Lunatimonas sp.]|nr:transglycosylase SLT domain-containing protein [Lunatimonas sp.]
MNSQSHNRSPLFFLIGFLFWGSLTQAQELGVYSGQGLGEDTVIAPQYDFDYIPDFTYEQVKQRIEDMETDMPFELNETIFAFIDYFVVRNRSYTKMVLQREEIFFPLFEESLKDHNMPEDVKFLAVIESGLNPKAKSRVGAMGLWQFMPYTGRDFKLNVSPYVDDRMDPEMATEAAMKFLKSLYKRYNDWELAMAAYNCGPGNVNKAIRRSGGKRTFWEIYQYLPKETRSYIPQFQAIMYVMRHPEYHNLHLEEPTFSLGYEKLAWSGDLDLEQLAQLTTMCIEDLEHLNPALLSRKLPDLRKEIMLNIPKMRHTFLVDNLGWIQDSLRVQAVEFLAENPPQSVVALPTSTYTATYRVQSGDVLGKIAQRYNVSVTDLRNWNGISGNMIKVGQVLHIHHENASFGKNI